MSRNSSIFGRRNLNTQILQQPMEVKYSLVAAKSSLHVITLYFT